MWLERIEKIVRGMFGRYQMQLLKTCLCLKSGDMFVCVLFI